MSSYKFLVFLTPAEKLPNVDVWPCFKKIPHAVYSPISLELESFWERIFLRICFPPARKSSTRTHLDPVNPYPFSFGKTVFLSSHPLYLVRTATDFSRTISRAEIFEYAVFVYQCGRWKRNFLKTTSQFAALPPCLLHKTNSISYVKYFLLKCSCLLFQNSTSSLGFLSPSVSIAKTLSDSTEVHKQDLGGGPVHAYPFLFENTFFFADILAFRLHISVENGDRKGNVRKRLLESKFFKRPFSFRLWRQDF